MIISYSQHIEAPIDTVFALVDDDEKLKLWMDGLLETTYPEGQNRDNPVGTRFRQKIREGGRVQEYEGEVTQYQKPNLIGVRIGTSQFSIDVDYRFEEEDAGTRLDYRCELTSERWFFRVMGLLCRWLTDRILKKQMAALKRIAECGVT